MLSLEAMSSRITLSNRFPRILPTTPVAFKDASLSPKLGRSKNHSSSAQPLSVLGLVPGNIALYTGLSSIVSLIARDLLTACPLVSEIYAMCWVGSLPSHQPTVPINVNVLADSGGATITVCPKESSPIAGMTISLRCGGGIAAAPTFVL